jgi:hypothetical protein
MTTLAMWEMNAKLRPITVAVLREHADRLARSLGVTVHHSAQEYAQGSRDVYGPAITSDELYAGRLHEYGHTQTRHLRAHGVTVRVGAFRIANTASEAAAWSWAREHALIWTDAMQTCLRTSLYTYVPYARLGLKDRLWRELDYVGGRLTVGHAKHMLETVGQPSVEQLRQRLERLT